MQKKRKAIIISVLIILVLTTMVAMLISFHQNKTYRNNIYAMLPPRINYNNESISTSLNADFVTRLLESKRSLYLKEIDEEQKHITISIPNKVTITVYPNNDDSVLVTYEPHHFGLKQKYKLSGFGNFNRYLEDLYEITGNEVFNETLDLPKAE